MLHLRLLDRARLVSLVCVILIPSFRSAKALDPAKTVKQYVPKLLTVTDGLPQPWVQAIVQTSDGYMWFGTQEGLSRFDGAQFRNFDKNNAPGINHNNIRVLLADHADGALWIGTYGGGLARYQAGTFRAFTTEDGLPGNFILALAQGPEGDIWIGTDKGVAVFKKGKIKQLELPQEATKRPVLQMTASPDGSIWFLIGSTVYRVGRDGKLSRAEFHFPEMRFIYVDHEGNIWVGTMTHGLYKWSKGKATHYGDTSRLPKAPIRAVYQDREGKIWVAAYGAGLCRLQPEDSFECYTAKEGLPESTVVAIYEDHEGNLWLGTEDNGTIRLRDSNFVTYDTRMGLANNYVLGIHESENGDLWIGSRPGLTRIRDGKITTIKLAATLPGNTVSVVEDAGNGDLWVGTEQGLKLLHNDRVIRIFTTQDGLATNDIHALLRDRRGRLWIGDRSGGLTRYEQGKFRRFTQKDGLSSVRVRNIFEDHAGNVWFSTEEGLTRFKDGVFTNFALEKGKGGATGGAVCIYEDEAHAFWIGTYGSGLIRFRDGTFVSFNRKDGLFDDSIWSIVEDNSGNLWMSSNRGLFRVRKGDLDDFASGKIATISSTSYDTADGLMTTDFNGGEQATGWKTRAGKLVFASSRGVVEVDPNHFHKNALAPPVVIEDAVVNKLRLSGQRNVPVGRGELEFRFAGLSFTAPEKVVTKYKLEGFDKDWISAGTRHVAYYTNIPPGQYQFRVLAANNDGVWNNTGAAFDIYLKPHLYQTVWFDLVCVLGVVLMAGGAYRFRVRQLRKHEEELVLLVNERTKELQEEIAERKLATQKAEAATQAKGEFLANMSHEIRTPLNGVMGALDLAVHTELTAEQGELLQMCHSSADSLLAVLNDILDFSKIEAGKLRFEETDFDIAGALAEAARTVAVHAHQKHLELVYFVDPSVPARLVGDSARLKQVLINLLGNAVKFTDRGEVFLRVRVEGQEAGKVDLRFSVSDTGVGIPADKQQAIFEAFAQADTSVSRRFGGTGLGLAICARIVRLMGGRLWVESAPGKGSTFHFTASLKLPENFTIAVQDDVLGRRDDRRVLVADDSQTNCWVLAQILRSWDMDPTCVTSGAEALQLLKQQSREGKPFPLLISDYRMPGMDGFTLVQEIKKTPGPTPKTIMMLTSDDYAATATRCRQLGIQSTLIKPVPQSELWAAIKGQLQPSASNKLEIGQVTRKRVEPAAKLRILLAEDNRVNQKLAARMLEQMGHQVTVAENGKVALEQLQRQSQKDDGFDLVFMDVHMPEMDGYAATQAIRAWEKQEGPGKHVPIIAMTANAMAGDRDKCLQHGMDGYVAKPISREDLVRAVHEVSGHAYNKIPEGPAPVAMSDAEVSSIG